MESINCLEDINKIISYNEIVLLYFGDKHCSVCVTIKPRLVELLNRYPKIIAVHIDIEKLQQIAANYNVFTIPAVLLLIDGKESIREARYINMKNLENKIERYYNLYFD